MFAGFFIAALLVAFSHAYPFRPEMKKLQPETLDCHNNPPVLSYHFHITYMLTNSKQITDVQTLRDQAMKFFAPMLGSQPNCVGTKVSPSGRYDNGHLCMIVDHNLSNDTIGPFAVGEWSMWVPVHSYGTVLPWFLENHGEFSLLIHTNTGCEYEDHSIYAQWSGPAWNMDLSIFTPWEQTDEFGEKLGTSRNPVCMSQGDVCGMNGYAQIVCCPGTSCTPSSSTDGKATGTFLCK